MAVEVRAVVADAAIKAGGMSLLTQFVTTGEIKLLEAYPSKKT